MVFVACGLNHQTASIDIREKVAIPIARHEEWLHRLLSNPAVNEAAILSTCNRTELYCDTEDPQLIPAWLADEHQLSAAELSAALYLYQSSEAVRHCLRVASGLDSMMIGEPQILGQMKEAYQSACAFGAIKNNLHSLFAYIFNAAKKIRTISGVGNNPVSVAYAGVQLIGQFAPNFTDLNVFLIGSGETAALIAKYLKQQGVQRFMITSRTHENAQQLAEKFGGNTLPISDIPHYLSTADVVISATTCPLPFINKNMVEHALIQRQQRPIFFLDLAVPRDIEPNVKELEQVILYNIDDLHGLTSKGMEERRQAALQAEQLIDQELDNYLRRHRSLQANSLICDYRSYMHDLAQQELQRAQQKLSAGHNPQHILNEFSERLVKKLTHYPTTGLKQIAWDGQEELLNLAQYLFNLPAQSSYEKIS